MAVKCRLEGRDESTSKTWLRRAGGVNVFARIDILETSSNTNCDGSAVVCMHGSSGREPEVKRVPVPGCWSHE
jgi:hypothetical protein